MILTKTALAVLHQPIFCCIYSHFSCLKSGNFYIQFLHAERARVASTIFYFKKILIFPASFTAIGAAQKRRFPLQPSSTPAARRSAPARAPHYHRTACGVFLQPFVQARAAKTAVSSSTQTKFLLHLLPFFVQNLSLFLHPISAFGTSRGSLNNF